VEHAVEFALKNGYKHIDTAAGYRNETGQLFSPSLFSRDFFLSTIKQKLDMESKLPV